MSSACPFPRSARGPPGSDGGGACASGPSAACRETLKPERLPRAAMKAARARQRKSSLASRSTL